MTDGTWPFNETAEARFWVKVDRRGPDECWPWIAGRNTEGYGQFRPGGMAAHQNASRCAWALAHGEWPATQVCVCHGCDNPPCCNPAHLFLGSTADNAADRTSKGRGPRSAGELNGAARLTVEQVREIRRVHATGEHRQADIAAMFNTTQSTVSLIVRREAWAHVE